MVLNDDYQGGEFYFRDQDVLIQPNTGQLLGFTSGLKHVHGVKKVTSGTRFALPMWFCSDQTRAYPEYR